MNGTISREKIKSFLELRIKIKSAVLIIVFSVILYAVSGFLAYRLVVWNRVEGSLSLNKEIARLKSKLDRSPSDASLHLSLARALHVKKEHKEAELRYKHVLELEPDNIQAQYFLGTLLAELGNASEAIIYLDKVIAKNKSHAEAHFALGLAYRAQDDERNSIDHLMKAVKLQPSSATFHYELGRTLELWGRKKEAIISFGSALRYDPEYPEARDALKRLKAVKQE